MSNIGKGFLVGFGTVVGKWLAAETITYIEDTEQYRKITKALQKWLPKRKEPSNKLKMTQIGFDR